jgi:hypothetical protein
MTDRGRNLLEAGSDLDGGGTTKSKRKQNENERHFDF